jgi:type I restriction enzyme S subunit
MKTDLLRKYLLQLAIQGKLVPQQTSEGTAQDLVDNIREHKAELIREKKLKKDPNESYIYRDDEGHFMERIGKQEPVCIDKNLPFVVPEGWTWARLGSIETVIGGYAFQSENFTSDGSRVIRISDIGENGFINNRIVRHVYVDALSPFIINQNDILIAMTGGTVGKSLYVQNLLERRMLLNQRVAIVRCGIVNSSYVSSFVKSYYIQSEIDNVKNSTNDNISMKNIMNFLLPLPPLAEQARIVKKMEELQKELEEMDASRTDMKKRCDLTRKMILQQAIKGALVPQQTSEGTAQDLVDNIREEKAVLVSEKKLKKDPNESYIYRDEEGHFMERIGKQEPVCIDKNLPFAVPVGWTWARLGSIATDVLGKTLDKLKNTGEYNPYLCNINIKWGSFDLQSIRKMRFEKEEIEKYNIKRNDLLLCEGGEIGKCAVWNEKETNLKFQNAIHRIRFFNDISPYFFMLFFMYYKASNKLEKYGKGVTIKHLTKESLNTIFLPLPPLAEQARIVKKVEELLEELDEMEKAVG